MTNDLSSSAKLFANDTSLFSVVFNVDATAKELNDDLAKVQDWALRWKMSFNPDISKQAQEVIFSRKLKKTPHPPLMFNSNLVNKASSQKHLGIILDESLSFEEHLKTISVKTNKALYILRKLQNLLPRDALITLYKSFIRPYLDYGDIIYEQAFNSSFHEKLESIQYNASLAITEVPQGKNFTTN